MRTDRPATYGDGMVQRSRSWQLGSLAGIPIFLGRSWVLIAALITVFFGPLVESLVPEARLNGYLVAFFFAVLLLLSVLAHEAAHALTARALGYRVNRIVADFWGGHTAYDGTGSTPGRAALVAVSGPLANAGLAVVGFGLAQAVPAGQVPWLLLTTFTTANAFVAAFNLLPGLPLDGGFLVDSLVWKVSGSRGMGTLVAGWCGRALVILLAFWALVFPLIEQNDFDLTRVIWVGLISFFLWQGASVAIASGAARRHFEATTIDRVARPASVVSVADLIGDIPWSSAGVWLVRNDAGALVGIVDETARRAIPTAQAQLATVRSVTRQQPEGWAMSADPADDVTAVVVQMQKLQQPFIALEVSEPPTFRIILATDLD